MTLSSDRKNCITLIFPCYCPSENFSEFLRSINSENISFKFIIINDGSPEKYNSIFQKLNEMSQVTLLHHTKNLGKGRALKTGFNHALLHHKDSIGVVTADCDGQHKVKDILKLAEALVQNSSQSSTFFAILGSRAFKNDTPLRSRFGNKLTQFIFHRFVGLKIGDTQTGLRAFPFSILTKLIQIPGERYEYETNVLLELAHEEIPVLEVQIETVYINENKSSHFNPIKDSMRIYFLIVRFLSSSISSSLLDIIVFALLIKSELTIMQSMLISRFVAGWFNFYLNRKIVFKHSGKLGLTILRYWLFVFTMGIISSLVVSGLSHFSTHIVFLKFLSESTLFLASFSIQKEFIFKNRDHQKRSSL